MNEFIPLMVIIPIACALLLNLFHKKDKTVILMGIIVAIVLPIIPLIANYGLHYFGGHAPLITNSTLLSTLPSTIQNSALALFHPAVTYSYGALQKIFIFILGIIAFFAIFNSLSQNKKVSGPLMFLMFMGTAAVTAILLSDDIFHMYIFFEISALTQTGIILTSKTENNYETALKYMILGSIGGPLLLLGIGFVLGAVGSVNITDIVYAISHNLVDPLSPTLLFAFGLIFFGWLYTSGLPPFHTIKSGVYSKALPNASVLLQAFTVIIFIAIGIAIFRIFSYLPFFKTLIVVFSLIAMVLGVTMAIMQTDFRRMIAFLAVGELGYIGLGFGLATKLSITAGLFQAVNELVITALLFIGFGTILYLTKISDTRKLGGMIQHNSIVAIMVLIGGFAMAGVPPLNGFQSKLMIIQASLQSGFPEISIIAILVSIVTFMVFMKAYHSIYLKPKPNDLVGADKLVPRSSIAAIAILLIICIVLGLFPHLVTDNISQFAMGLI
ncbi:F(420)H(2) dehydrogenase subunit N [Candidatus Methanobinarius endosymbioticus]|uniref:F(420)H(2) dehydrogenase subunit N n=1 Tax=Candidatus Methanobinarius endosymbioticus TaxID=2006182 RepID=A0A366MA26_9EURY|nr:F(420)H(2) dehydrogenase subunit N [Candidatus Methanobinarius endosymbioticus]